VSVGEGRLAMRKIDLSRPRSAVENRALFRGEPRPRGIPKRLWPRPRTAPVTGWSSRLRIRFRIITYS